MCVAGMLGVLLSPALTRANDDSAGLDISSDTDLVVLHFNLTSGTEYWIDDSTNLQDPAWTNLFFEVHHAQSGIENMLIPPHPDDPPARFFRLRYMEETREAFEGIAEDEMDVDAETERVQALQEALENEGAGATVTIPDFPHDDYIHATHEEDDGNEFIEVERHLFFGTNVTFYYSPTNGVTADFLMATAPTTEPLNRITSVRTHEDQSSTPGGLVVRFPGAVFTDANGNRTTGDIIVRGNVVRAGEYIFDFGSSALGWQPPSVSARSWDIWDQMPQGFDPHPPGCDDNAASIWNGPVFSVTHTRLSYDFQLDWSIDEHYSFGVQHSMVWHCPDGPLERKVTVSFKYSIYVNGALHDYQEAFYNCDVAG